MKYFLFFIIPLNCLISCGNPSKIEFPNKNLSIKEDSLFYKNKPYSGKIIISQPDKANGYEGILNFQNGNLCSENMIKNIKTKEHSKFIILNNELDGDIVINKPLENLSIKLDYTKGNIKRLLFKNKNTNDDYNLCFTGGLANGCLIINNKEMFFKDSRFLSENPDENIKLTFNLRTGEANLERLLKIDSLDETIIERHNIFLGINIRELQKDILNKIIR